MDCLEKRLSGGLRDIADRVSQPPVSSSVTALRPTAGRRARVLVPAGAVLAIALVGGAAVGVVNLQERESSTVVTSGGEGASNDRPSPMPATGTNGPATDVFAVDAAADRIAAFADRPGFGKATVDYDTSTVTVFWKGTPPPEVTKMTGVGDNGVNVVVAAAQYSAEEFKAAGHAALRSDPESVVAAMSNPDMSGLVVEVLDTWGGSESKLQEATGMPVTVRVVNEGFVPLVHSSTSRVADH